MDAGLVGVMGEVAGAGAALAGLILVFMGATVAAFEGYDGGGQKLVVKKYRPRVWLAFSGLCFSLLATTLAIAAKAGAPICVAWAAIVLLALGALSVVFAALLTALEIG